MRSEDAIFEFLSHRDWMERFLQIAEEFSMEDVTVAILRTLKMMFKTDRSFDLVREMYPSMGEFLAQSVGAYFDTPAVMKESVAAFDLLLTRPHYINLVKSKWYAKILAIRQDPRQAEHSEALDRILEKLKQR